MEFLSMTLILYRRPSRYATGQVEVLEDLIHIYRNRRGWRVWTAMHVLLDATAFADDLATGLEEFPLTRTDIPRAQATRA